MRRNLTKKEKHPSTKTPVQIVAAGNVLIQVSVYREFFHYSKRQLCGTIFCVNIVMTQRSAIWKKKNLILGGKAI